MQQLRSSTANKRPVPANMTDGQVAVNTAAISPGLFFKDAAGTLVKVGPVHVGTTAPNVTPASGGQTGNSVGEQWLDTSSSRYVFKIWDGTTWRTEAGEFVDASGDTMTGPLVMDNQQQIRFRETTANGTNFIALQATASVASDKTITLPDVTGTVVTTGDTSTVTSTMILDGTIVDADVNANAAIALSKLATGALPTAITVASANIVDGAILNADINASAAIAGTKISPDFGSQNRTSTGTSTAASFIPTSSTVPTNGVYLPAANSVALATNGTGRLFISDTKVQVTNPGNTAEFEVGVGATGNNFAVVNLIGDTTYSIYGLRLIRLNTGANADSQINHRGTGPLALNAIDAGNIQLKISNTERARIDSSGRLLLGTSTNTDNNIIQTFNNGIGITSFSADQYAYGNLVFTKSRGTASNSRTPVTSGDELGGLYFQGADGTNYRYGASIAAVVDGTPGTNNMPGRIVLSTTVSGASSPTERMRIDSNGFASHTGAIGRGAPVTKTGAFTVGIAENWLICNGTASITVTLPTASAWIGREIMLKTIAAFTVVSTSSNVVPLAGGAAGTAILAATAGKYATLVSDGTNWIIMQAN